VFEIWFDVKFVLEVHVGASVDDDGVLSVLVDVDVGHACGFVVEDFPVQFDVGLLHLCF
jgi:hypothetical protein